MTYTKALLIIWNPRAYSAAVARAAAAFILGTIDAESADVSQAVAVL